MPAPKGHEPYEGCEKGAAFGFLGKPPDKYSLEEISELGKGVIDWIKQDNNIWIKYYFLLQTPLITWKTVQTLMTNNAEFRACIEQAKLIQESKLLTEPYDKTKQKDGYHARWMLARHHKGEWEEKNIVVATEEQKTNLDNTMDMIDYLQSKKESHE